MKTTFLILCLFSCLFAKTQTTERFVVSSAGSSIKQGLYSVDFSLGETIGHYFSTAQYIVTPGFQQGHINQRSLFIDLGGSIVSGSVLLSWLLPFEKNSIRFYIEKQRDTLHPFEIIDSVQTNAPGGNSSTAMYYSHTDRDPSQGVNSYRIKLVLKDGTVRYSNTIQIVYKSALWWIISVYPNPARETSRVRVYAKEAVYAAYNICDAEGKIFFTGKQYLEKGFSEIQLNAASLPAATYFFNLHSIDKSAPDLVTRFIKLP